MCELSNLGALLAWTAGQLHLLAIKLATASGPGVTKTAPAWAGLIPPGALGCCLAPAYREEVSGLLFP